MNNLDQIFGYYDKLIGNLSPQNQALISVALLLFLIWQIFMIVKSGHWIFIAALVLLLPSTWPATKTVGKFIWIIIKFLITRAQVTF